MNNKDKTRNGKPGPKPGKKKGVNARPGVNTQAKKIAIKAPTAQMAVVQIRQREQVKAQAKKRNLPRDSINFFTSAIDPMHDTRITFCGWPDKNIEQSVIRQIPQSFELAMPVANPNFAAATVWDCHINLQPWMNQVLFHERERVNNNIFVTSGNTCDIGGLQAYATLPGGDFTYGAENTLATGTVPLIGSLGIKESVSVGVGRLCGIGVEVINSTAPLYQSGLVYCWRAPEPVSDPQTWYQSASSGTTPNIVYLQNAFTGQVFRHPPRNIAEAQLYTGVESWHAKEGSYMVGTFNDFDNEPKMVSYEQPIIINSQDVEDHTYSILDTLPVPNETAVWVPDAIQSLSVPGQFGLPGMKVYPINEMGMIFVGLTKETTLTMKLTYYYESFPSLAQTDILTLAKPSTRYDPLVLKLLAETMRTLPVAVMSKENAEGDWWDRVLEAVQIIAPGVMAMIPGGEVLAPGVLSAITSLRSFRNSES